MIDNIIFEGMIQTPLGSVYTKLVGDVNNTLPVIVVFPGGPGFGHEVYQGHSGHFAEHARMLFFDPIGSGKSSKLDNHKEYTQDNYIKTVKALVDHFNFKNIIILGTSYGSMTAQKFAIDYSELVSKLILVGGAPSHHFLESAKEQLDKRGTDEQKAISKILFDGNLTDEKDVARFMSVMAPLYSNRAQKTGASAYKATGSVEPLNMAFRTRFDHFDYREKLKKLTIPALIFVGEDDWVNPVEQVSLIAELMPNAKLIIVEDSGHSIAVDRPDIYTPAVIDFLNN